MEKFYNLMLNVFEIFDNEWAILVSGKEKPNPMTISWGGFGMLYNKPVVTVYVRRNRFSFKLMWEYNEFTVNFLPSNYRNALEICGSLSGRDYDKWEKAKISKEKSDFISVPIIKEAYLSFELRTILKIPFKRENFVSQDVLDFYENEEYHCAFIGEVLKIHKR